MDKKIDKQNKITNYFKKPEKNNKNNTNNNKLNIKSDNKDNINYDNCKYQYVYDKNSNSTKLRNKKGK
jgi:hypothetical protein